MGPFDRTRVTEWLALVQADYDEQRPDDWRSSIEPADGSWGAVASSTGRSSPRQSSAGVLHPDAWGYGYATEAGRACAHWGFQNLDVSYLTAMIRPDNQRSTAVAQRIGLSPIRPDVLLGEPVNVYSISREQWLDPTGTGDSQATPKPPQRTDQGGR